MNERDKSEQVAVTEPPRKKRGTAFWLQVAAWGLALCVLAGSLVYYNFLDGFDMGGSGSNNSQSGNQGNQGNQGGSQGNQGNQGENQGSQGGEAVHYGNAVGDTCYDFSLETYFGKGTFTLSEHRGEIVLINFWYTRCTPCVGELPMINAVTEEYGITTVAIHSAQFFENPRSMEGNEAWMERKTCTIDPSRTWSSYSIIFAQDTGAGLYSDTFTMLAGADASSYPVNILLDREGKIVFNQPGGLVRETFEAQLIELGAQKKA